MKQNGPDLFQFFETAKYVQKYSTDHSQNRVNIDRMIKGDKLLVHRTAAQSYENTGQYHYGNDHIMWPS